MAETESQSLKVRENRLRRALERQGRRLVKRRRKDRRAKDYGRYVIVFERSGEIVNTDMERKPLTLAQAERWADMEADDRRHLELCERFDVALTTALNCALLEGKPVDLSHVMYTLRDAGGDKAAMEALQSAWEGFYDGIEQARKEIHDGIDAAGVFDVVFEGIEELDLNDPVAVKRANEEAKAAWDLYRRDPKLARRLNKKFRGDARAHCEAILEAEREHAAAAQARDPTSAA